ncbi:L,D-transpeptidase family protein [Pseudochrobactrum sp. HB0163]|uniref:L,D-transpeptidase family protein n=1 Tax=Pseudochrobactrum sp. HB0163 TaxID=3450708 RepID=UPI003F6DD097
MTFPLKTRYSLITVSKRKACLATALALIGAMAVLAPAQEAAAASNLMELFRQKREARQQAPRQEIQPAPMPQGGNAGQKAQISRTAPAPKPAAPVKTVTVKGPQFYDYRPEKLVRIDFSPVDMQLTSSVSEDEGHVVADQAAADNAPLFSPVRILGEAGHLFGDLQQQSVKLINQAGVPAQAGGSDIVAPKTGGKIDQAQVNAVLEAMKLTNVQAEQPVAEAILAFYATEHRLLWSDGLHVSQNAQNVLNLFERAEEDGLSSAEYAVREPEAQFDMANKAQRIREMADFELRMSARALRYALDAGEGRVIANRLSGFHDLPRNRIKPDVMLKALADDADPAAILRGLHPQSRYYQQLKAQLAAMKPAQAEDIRIAPDTLIRPGQSNPELPKILALISKKAPAGYLNSYQEIFDRHYMSELYDPELVAAVKDYQKLMGKTPDGIIGRATIAALQGESPAVRRERILYAMERLRWLPLDFGERYVFVNQPAYRAQYFNKGKEQLAMDVVIGSPRNQTHFFYDTISTVVFNPSWGVPRSIVMNEMMPRIMADTNYLSRNNYEVISGGKSVPASAVNWSAVAQGKAHVGIRQKPGPNNALGELKILFPNSHDIYLHDTPSKATFKRDMRAVSHGCIRLADPRAMASAVMGTEQEKLSRYFGKSERGIKVPQGVPIYLAYFTAWPDEATGKIRYYDDVYGRDAALAKAFAKTGQSRMAAM